MLSEVTNFAGHKGSAVLEFEIGSVNAAKDRLRKKKHYPAIGQFKVLAKE